MDTSEPVDALEPTGARLRYDEYKDSGLDWLSEIPSHWDPTRLRFLLEISPSKSEVRNLADGTEVSFVPMEAVKENGGLNLGETEELEEVVDGYTYFRDGDVLVAKITPCFENRKGALASELANGIGFGTTELHVLRPGPELNARFLYYATMSHPFRKIGESTMYGAGGQKRVSDDFIENLRWPIPSLPEQRAIAAFLDRETERIDALIEKKEELIDLLEEKRTTLISRVVTKGLDADVEMKDSGVEWLGEIPAHWESSRLKWCTRQKSSICYGIVQPGDHVEDGVPFVQTTNISTGTFELDHLQRTTQEIAAEYSRSRLETGDVILGIRASIGSAYVVPKELEGANLSRGIARIAVNDEVQAEYLKFYLSSNHAENYWSLAQQGATFNEVSIANVRELSVPIPPLDEQYQIANYLTKRTERIDGLIGKVDEAIGRLKEYRTALISAAVTGQIDVREGVQT
jgi:type I restriction enzyme S subunit